MRESFFFFSSFFYLLLLLLFFTLPAAVCLFSSFSPSFSRKYSRTIHTYVYIKGIIYINDVIFEFVSERLIPRGMGYLCSTSCRIDVSTITVLRFINKIKRPGYLLLRIPILQHVLPLLPLITGRIFSFPPFPLEETTPSNPPTGGFHRFRSFFGKREEGEGPNWRVQVELRGSTMPRTFLRFFGGRFTRPVMHFSTGEKAERRTEREKKGKK